MMFEVEHEQKNSTLTHTHAGRQKEDHTFSSCQGHRASIAAVIIMISSNEGAMEVNATRSLFFNTACYYHFLSLLSDLHSRLVL